MEGGVARLQLRCLVVVVVMCGGPMMLVCRNAVMVLRMLVIRVLVDVQCRDLAGGRGQDQSEQDCNRPMHLSSVCNGIASVKREGACGAPECVMDQ